MFAELFILGLCAHIVADWFLQNDWMANEKVNFWHKAAWIHSLIHYVCASFVFGLEWASVVFITHIFIDTRKPLEWWRRTFRMKMRDDSQPFESPHNSIARHVAFWQDQMAHVLVIAIIAWLMAKGV